MANEFDPREFKQSGTQAGFTEDQLEWLLEHMATVPHTHDAEDIEGLDEAIEEIIEDGEGPEE